MSKLSRRIKRWLSGLARGRREGMLPPPPIDDAALEAELHADSSPSATASAPGAAPAAGTGDAASASSGSVHWSGALSADAEDEP